MRVYLAHGASGTADSMRPFVEGLREAGIDAATVGLPVRKAEDAVAVYRAAVGDDLSGSIIGGHSYGGRVASLLAAQELVAGLVLLSYPLHRPGKPDDQRVEHWPLIACPVLLISGEADPFARLGQLRTAVGLLSGAELITYPGVRHGVGGARLVDTTDHIARFVARLSQAGARDGPAL